MGSRHELSLVRLLDSGVFSLTWILYRSVLAKRYQSDRLTSLCLDFRVSEDEAKAAC